MTKQNNIGVYDRDVAMLLDANCAIIYSMIKGWVEHNENNNKNFFDGRYWTYNSMRAWSLDLPFLTENQIRYALERLEKAGLIATGNYNKVAYDRTKWYSINPVSQTGKPAKTDDSISEQSQFHLGTIANGVDSNPEPIPTINTSINQDKDSLLLLPEEKFSKNSENENPEQSEKTAKVFKAYQSEIGLITPIVAEDIKACLEIDDIPADWIIEAITEAARNNARSWSYVLGILKNWKKNGFKAQKPESKPVTKPQAKSKDKPQTTGRYAPEHEESRTIVKGSETHFIEGKIRYTGGENDEIPF